MFLQSFLGFFANIWERKGRWGLKQIRWDLIHIFYFLFDLYKLKNEFLKDGTRTLRPYYTEVLYALHGALNLLKSLRFETFSLFWRAAMCEHRFMTKGWAGPEQILFKTIRVWFSKSFVNISFSFQAYFSVDIVFFVLELVYCRPWTFF